MWAALPHRTGEKRKCVYRFRLMNDLKRYFQKGFTFSRFLEETRESKHPWQQFYQRARAPEDLLSAARGLPGSWRFLALCEEWCGDGANSLPYLARAVEAVEKLDLRVLSRDANPELMDRYLTHGNRAIPVVIVLDEAFREVGWWGPRPAPLQELFLREIKPLPKEDRYPRLRAWYARDRGRTALKEIFQILPVLV